MTAEEPLRPEGKPEGLGPSARGPSLRGVSEARLLYAALPTVLMYPFGLLVLCVLILYL